MTKNEPNASVTRLSSAQLSKFINLSEKTPEPWDEKDMAAMLQHQYDAPLGFDLSTLSSSEKESTALETTLREAGPSQIRTFRDLLFHKNPPMDLLEHTKDFFKQRVKACKTKSPEGQVAYVFYLTSILKKPGISSLKESQLRVGVQWVLKQTWVDDKTKVLISNLGGDYVCGET
jgi:hypothetical protein